MEQKETEEQGIEIGKKVKVWSVILLLGLMLFFVKQLVEHKVSSVSEFQTYLGSFGKIGPIVLVIIQALQVVVPILPGYLGCAAGAMGFGTATGFWCNYIGISLGSIAAFFIARKFGKKVVLTMFSEKQYQKWAEKISKKKSYDVFLFIATLLPLFPDDFLCYFSGAMKMKAGKFIRIIVLGKPWCILAYSIGFGLIQ